MSDNEEEFQEKLEYILLENLLKDIPPFEGDFVLPDLSNTFPSDWDDYEDRVDDSSLFNPNK